MQSRGGDDTAPNRFRVEIDNAELHNPLGFKFFFTAEIGVSLALERRKPGVTGYREP
jgi:hypothetical protein